MFVANTIIENLLQAKKAQAAMTLDALYAADLQQWPSMDISTILHYLSMSGISIGESIVRRGLFDLARLGLLTTKKIMTRSKGRPMWSYGIKPLAKMAEILGVKLHRDEHADSVPKAAFKSTRAFRGALHYALLKRLGTSQLSRKKLGARLGVGGRSTFNYEIGLDIEITQRVDSQLLTALDIPQAPTTRPKNNVFLRVEWYRELSVEELTEKYSEFDTTPALLRREKKLEWRYMPYTKFILERELARGHTVWKVKQITNEYKVA